MPISFNNAQTSQPAGALIPHGTAVPVQMTVRPQGAGDGGWLKVSDRTGAEMIDAEFVVLEGPHARQRFWSYFTIGGPTEGHQKAGEISRGNIRALLESARGIKPNDTSPEAQAARQIEDYGDLDGLRFWCVVKLEAGTGGYKDKNQFHYAITPDRKEWTKLEQAKRPATTARPASTPASTGSSSRPSWAGTSKGPASDLNDSIPF